MKRADIVRFGIVSFKLITGTFEFLGGLILVAVPSPVLQTIVDLLVREEVVEDPHDPVVAFIQRHLEGFLNERKGVGVGLVVLGTIKIVGAIGLIRGRAWGYYLLVVALVVFLSIELVRLSEAYSNTGLLVTATDAIVLILMLTFRRRFIEHHNATTLNRSGDADQRRI